jgi:Xaa-Pro aminopeptidase
MSCCLTSGLLPVQVGMVCSNEPGYYEDGGFGIRIENLLTIEEAGTEFRCVCLCLSRASQASSATTAIGLCL